MEQKSQLATALESLDASKAQVLLLEKQTSSLVPMLLFLQLAFCDAVYLIPLHDWLCMIGCAQEAQLHDIKVSHAREIELKDKIIRSTKEDASKWQAIYMSSNKVDIEQFKSFQSLLRSASSPPSKGAAASSAD